VYKKGIYYSDTMQHLQTTVTEILGQINSKLCDTLKKVTFLIICCRDGATPVIHFCDPDEPILKMEKWAD